MTVAVFAIVLCSGLAGFRLDPDSTFYASGNVSVINSVIAGMVGRAWGMTGLIVMSALASALLFKSVRKRMLLLLGAGFWLLFPGADAIGALFLVFASRSGATKTMLSLSFLAHPVAALQGLPLLSERTRRYVLPWGLFVCASVFAVFILMEPEGETVSSLDHLAYMSRYMLPSIALFAARRTEA